MPVRSLSSSVLKWPDGHSVDQAIRLWTQKVLQHRDDVLRVGYFGSYARGDWGVGSDLDVIIITAYAEINRLSRFKIDLKPAERLLPHFRRRVVSQGEIIYEASESGRT
jgi:predicted nucleotidyltransferase